MSKLETWDKVNKFAAGAKDVEHVHEIGIPTNPDTFIFPVEVGNGKEKTEEHVP